MWPKHNADERWCPPTSVYLLWHNATHDWDTSTFIWDTWFCFFVFLQRETEGRFCCRGHPFCPLWRNMYTDIDIFKEDINFFFNWQRRKTKRSELWEALENVVEMSRKAVETGDGSQRQEKWSEAPLDDIKSLFNYWQYAYGNRLSNQWTHSSWKQRGINLVTSGGGWIWISLFFRESWIKSTGRTVPRVSIFAQPMVLLPVSFLRLADGQHWPGVSRKQISSNHWKIKDSLFEECEGFSWLSFLRKQLNTKKQMKPKLTSNQTKKHELQFQRQTATRSSPFLSWLLVPHFFLNAIFVCLFVWSIDFIFLFS